VARAKRTDRADARRRYRQTIGADPDGFEADDTPVETPRDSRRSAPPVERPSITAAFRNAYRRANIREDIGFLPSLLTSRSFVIAIALIVFGTAAIAVAPDNFLTVLSFQALVIPPAMAPIFIVGFFARRASYLLGLIVSIVDVVAYAIFVFAIAPAVAATAPDPARQQELVYSAISVGPLSGIFFAAAAAWYRRFLALSNARTQQRRQSTPRNRKPARG
jgi:hypothetical protein